MVRSSSSRSLSRRLRICDWMETSRAEAKSASAQLVCCSIRGSWTQFSRAALSKGRFLAAVVPEPLWAASGIFEDQA
jgi:hypothetical protein